ncbi:DUF397 domain-containing protein [Streptomyces sp. NPDC101151]|uniref:DUF397 domain-containing protein n=1 Tax=Streptomyces sp. NPDC101151 TaxID=3366115 RepID=UPI00381453D1
MFSTPWQKSSYCGEGESCVHVAATAETIHLTESADPGGAILTATPAAFGTFIAVLKEETRRRAPIEVTIGEEGSVHLHETSAPDTVVTTDRRKWDAFVLGIRAGEFDHFQAIA